MIDHPYKHFEGTELWHVLDRAIGDLVENSDIEEKTLRQYIVGYLAKVLTDGGVVSKTAGVV